MARAAATIAALLASLLLVACGSEEPASVDPGSAADAPSFDAALARVPPQLESHYADGGKVMPGGPEALEAKLSELRGYPVVVNVWASWCGPCRSELPYLQSSAAKHLDEVAFLGIDSNDSDEAAETFLADHPMPYPSLADPHYEVARALDPALIAQPNTVYLDREGEVVHIQTGPYTSAAALEADIERYALRS